MSDWKDAMAVLKLRAKLDDIEFYSSGFILWATEFMVDHSTKTAFRDFLSSDFAGTLYVEGVFPIKKFKTKAALKEALSGYTVKEKFQYIGDIIRAKQTAERQTAD